MENVVFDKNMKALNGTHPIIYDAIMRMHDDTLQENVVVSYAKNGEPIIIYRKNGREYYLNSKYNPADEAKRFMEEYFSVPDKALVTMFGIANAFFCRELLINNKRKIKCVVYEPSVDIFIQVLKNIDITDVLVDERVSLVVDGINEQVLFNMFNDIIDTYNKRTNRHILLPKYKEVFSEAYAFFDKIIHEQYVHLRVETLTTGKYAARVCKNNLYNMCHLIGARSAADYTDVFPTDMPAVVVGAGPSLSKNVNLLKKAKGKAFIAVVDTALRYVCEAGVVPDAIFSIDFIKPVSLFECENISKIPFVASMDLNYEVLDKVKPKNLIYNVFEPITWELLEKVGGKKSDVDTGGSVANAIISTLILWGFKHIIMIGQDLALTDNKFHVGEDAVDFEKCIEVESITGGKVATRTELSLYIKWISDICRMFPNVTIIDATEGGAKKENTKIMSFQEAINQYCIHEYDIENLMQKPSRLFMGDDSMIITNAFETMTDDLNKLKNLTDLCVLECQRGAAMLENRIFDKTALMKINTMMGKLDEMLYSMKENTLISKYVVSTEYDLEEDLYIEEADDIAEAIRMYKKSEKYYQAVSDAIPCILDIITECKKGLQENKRQ